MDFEAIREIVLINHGLNIISATPLLDGKLLSVAVADNENGHLLSADGKLSLTFYTKIEVTTFFIKVYLPNGEQRYYDKKEIEHCYENHVQQLQQQIDMLIALLETILNILKHGKEKKITI